MHLLYRMIGPGSTGESGFGGNSFHVHPPIQEFILQLTPVQGHLVILRKYVMKPDRVEKKLKKLKIFNLFNSGFPFKVKVKG